MKQFVLPTLLLVTANTSIRHFIKKHLDAEFFILEAPQKTAALNTLRSSAVDLIILDADLEQPLELCQQMHQMSPHASILLITGRLKQSFRSAALHAGAVDFLSNLLDEEELKEVIAKVKRTEKVREKTSKLSTSISLPQEAHVDLKKKKLDRKKRRKLGLL